MSYEYAKATAMVIVDGSDSGKRMRDCVSQGGGAFLCRVWRVWVAVRSSSYGGVLSLEQPLGPRL